MATRARKASSVAAILRTNFSPITAPFAAASSRLAESFPTVILISDLVLGVSVSGHMIFAMTSAASADITLAANRCRASMPQSP